MLKELLQMSMMEVVPLMSTLPHPKIVSVRIGNADHDLSVDEEDEGLSSVYSIT
jgi:hypothetical protein